MPVIAVTLIWQLLSGLKRQAVDFIDGARQKATEFDSPELSSGHGRSRTHQWLLCYHRKPDFYSVQETLSVWPLQKNG